MSSDSNGQYLHTVWALSYGTWLKTRLWNLWKSIGPVLKMTIKRFSRQLILHHNDILGRIKGAVILVRLRKSNAVDKHEKHQSYLRSEDSDINPQGLESMQSERRALYGNQYMNIEGPSQCTGQKPSIVVPWLAKKHSCQKGIKQSD